MSASDDDFWMDLVSVCPDCGGASVCFAHVRGGAATYFGFDHELGWVPADAWRKHTRALDRWLSARAGLFPVGWRRLDGPPAVPAAAAAHAH